MWRVPDDDRITTIKVSQPVWEALHRKKGLGDSFDDVLRRELGIETADREPVESAESPASDATAQWDELLQRWREYMADRPPKTRHGQAAVERVLDVLREDGPMKTQDLRERVYEDFTGDWSSSRNMWQSIQRYFDEVPGIEKGEGHAEWRYAGDDEVRELLMRK